jgi:hypothetical protein
LNEVSDDAYRRMEIASQQLLAECSSAKEMLSPRPRAARWVADPSELGEDTDEQLDELIVGDLRDRLSKGNTVAHRPGCIRASRLPRQSIGDGLSCAACQRR